MTALVVAPRAMTKTAARHDAWLVRHAPTDWTGRRWCGRSDPPLSVKGRRIADASAERLAAELPGDVTILTSPLRRARETALAIAGAVGRPVSIVPDLVEVDFGRVDGLTWEEVARLEADLAGRIVAGPPVDWPGGETAASVADRAARVASAIRALDGPALVVSHGRFLAALQAELAGGDDDKQPIPLAPAGVIRVRFAGREENG
jgi:ribonuclease H / adenosylcobalamin/alpha-ribazole phosphatase